MDVFRATVHNANKADFIAWNYRVPMSPGGCSLDHIL